MQRLFSNLEILNPVKILNLVQNFSST